MSNPEIITAREAVTRLGLAGLDLGGRDDVLVEWTGYPQPFALGHYDEKGRRVSRHNCGGEVLFSWERTTVVGTLHIVINPEFLHDRYETYSPSGATLKVSWSGF